MTEEREERHKKVKRIEGEKREGMGEGRLSEESVEEKRRRGSEGEEFLRNRG